jgi:hypothetical protein
MNEKEFLAHVRKQIKGAPSIQAAADKLGCSRGQLSNFLSGRRPASAEMLRGMRMGRVKQWVYLPVKTRRKKARAKTARKKQ